MTPAPPLPETTAKLFVEQVRRLVRLLRYGSREVVFATAGALLLAAAKGAGSAALLAPLPKGVQSGLSLALGGAGVVCLGIAAVRIWRKVAAPPPEAGEPRLPALKGAASFGEQDAELFARLGRVDELQHLRQWILDDQRALLVVMGESGVGKTSLLRAGLAHELQRDALPVVYWEALPAGSEAGLLDAVRAAWSGPEPAPDSIAALARAVAQRRMVLVLDQLEQLSPEAHPGLFALLGAVLLANPPYPATWIVAFRREYAATWRDFELSLPEHAARRIETLSVKRLPLPAARRVVAVLAEEAGLAIDQSIVGELVDDLARDRQVSPVDIGITLLGLSELTGVDDDSPLTLAGFRAGGGPAGLLTRYLERVLGAFAPPDQGELLLALLALIDLEKDQRIAEGRDLSILAQRAGAASPGRFASGMRFLASGRARILEDLAPPSSEPRYRLVHERFIPAVRSLTGTLVAEAAQASALLDRCYRTWRTGRKGRDLLAGSQLRQVLQHQGYLAWGDDEPGKHIFLKRSKRRRMARRILVAGACTLAFGLSLELHARLERRELAGRLAGWNLPGDLDDRLGQLTELHLTGVSSLDWLGTARHLGTLTVTGVRTFNGLPPGLRRLKLVTAPSVSPSNLLGLPAGLQELKVSRGSHWVDRFPGDVATLSLKGLPRGLRALNISGISVADLSGLPAGLQSLAVEGDGIATFAGLPSELQELTIQGDKITSLAGLPAGLRSLDISGDGITALAGLPRGLQSLKIKGNRLTSLAGLPPDLRSLDATGENLGRLADLPPGLKSLKVEGGRLTALAELPAGLQELSLKRVEITTFAELPAGLQSMSLEGYQIASFAGLPAALRSLSAESCTITSLAHLPEGLESLDLQLCEIASLAGLPPGLQDLDLRASTTPNLKGLPEGLQYLRVGNNTPHLADLPRGLTVLELSLTDTADLSGLPSHLEALNLSETKITNLRGLPSTLQSLYISETGTASLAGLPQRLRSLTAWRTNIESLAGLPAGLQTLYVSGGFPTLQGLPAGLRTLYLWGDFTHLTGLPPRLQSLNLRAPLPNLAGLPAGLPSLDLSDSAIPNLAGLPPGLKKLTLPQNGMVKTLKDLPLTVQVLRFGASIYHGMTPPFDDEGY